MNEHWSFILISATGAVIQEILHWYGLRNKLDDSEQTRLLKSPFYWLITFLTIIASGVGSWLLFGPVKEGTDVLPVNVQLVIGAAFPLIFKKLVAKRQELGTQESKYTFNDVLNDYLK